jgi:uncharacterized membrane protein SirB2
VIEKSLALVMYLFMVYLALRPGNTRFMQVIGLIGAVSWIAYAGVVAVTKQPIFL